MSGEEPSPDSASGAIVAVARLCVSPRWNSALPCTTGTPPTYNKGEHIVIHRALVSSDIANMISLCIHVSLCIQLHHARKGFGS